MRAAVVAILVALVGGTSGEARTLVPMRVTADAAIAADGVSVRVEPPCAHVRIDLAVTPSDGIVLSTGGRSFPGRPLRGGWVGFFVAGSSAEPVRGRIAAPAGATMATDEGRPSARVMCRGEVPPDALGLVFDHRFGQNRPGGVAPMAAAAGAVAALLAIAVALAVRLKRLGRGAAGITPTSPGRDIV